MADDEQLKPKASAVPSSEGPEADDDRSVRELLQRALGAPAEPDIDVLALVQKRLRERSGGKFYGEGWSTSGEPPVAKYLVTSLLMLLIALAVYYLLGFVAADPDAARIERPRSLASRQR
jgi:hypothetical protein